MPERPHLKNVLEALAMPAYFAGLIVVLVLWLVALGH